MFYFDPQPFPAKHEFGMCDVCQKLPCHGRGFIFVNIFKVDSFLPAEVTPTGIETELLCSVSTQKVKQAQGWTHFSSPVSTLQL